MSTAFNALVEHPQIVLGILAGVVLTAIINAVRKIRRLITTGIVLAIAGGSATTSIPTLQNLFHSH
ncbi:hypothetical protein KL953_32735 [Mycolicibacterium goodii]|uniref:hypothetical protein n=1 Tax=Mycolicibacterium goodii TaxID=134601 RepID=UPI001BDD33C0|nr:hypothetical protein [Mycolicibacterium goodii]MBU8813644.1 hypothetical protein [Mycolicibacterium goodii]